MGCRQHADAATVAHPSAPSEHRCAKCSQLVTGPAHASQKVPVSSCLMVIGRFVLLFAAGFATVLAAIWVVNL